MLAACSLAPQKFIPSSQRTVSPLVAPSVDALTELHNTAEIVVVNGSEMGVLTLVLRDDGRFPGISRATVNGVAHTYRRLASERVSGRAAERGFLLVSPEIAATARSEGLDIRLCGVGTCYDVPLSEGPVPGL